MHDSTIQRPRRHFLSMLLALSLGCAGAANSEAQTEAAAASSAPSAAAPAADAPVLDSKLPRVELKTSMGDIVLELYPDKAPKTVDNFLRYVKEGFYKGTIFHRVINDFMIQGGGYGKDLREKPVHAPIQNEAKNGLKNEMYTIAMARTDYPHSATSQFFINVNDNVPLDYPSRDGWGYCVFGKVIAGTEVVDKIKQVETGSKSVFENLPLKPITIESAKLIKPAK